MAKKPPAPSDLADKFMLRMPDGMRDRIAEAAKANNRSMNAELIARLEASFEPSIPLSDPRADKFVHEIAREIAKGLDERFRGKSGIFGLGTPEDK